MNPLAEKIINSKDRALESVIIPEWDNLQVHVRSMGAEERAAYEQTLMELKDCTIGEKMARVKVMLVILCLCDEQGDRVFQQSDYDLVKQKSADAIDRVYELADKMNVVSQARIEDEKGN